MISLLKQDPLKVFHYSERYCIHSGDNAAAPQQLLSPVRKRKVHLGFFSEKIPPQQIECFVREGIS